MLEERPALDSALALPSGHAAVPAARVPARTLGVHLLVSILGAAVLTLLPWLVGMLIDDLGASTSQAGGIASLQLAGSASGYGVALIAGHRLSNSRMATLGVALLLVSFLGNILAHSLFAVGVLWAISGLGAGLAAASAYRSGALQAVPKHVFAAMVTGQMAFGLIAFLLVPMLEPGKRWLVYAALIGVCASALCFTRELRNEPPVAPGGQPATALSIGLGLGLPAFAMSSSLLLHFIANSMQWSFFERIGVMSGIDSATVSRGLALSMLTGLAGSAVSGVELRGLSERKVIVLGIALVIVSNLCMLSASAWSFTIAALLMNFAVMVVQPSYLSFLARQSRGAAAVTWGQLQTSIGMVIGPYAGGLLLEHRGIPVFIAGTVVVFLCALALALSGFALRSRDSAVRG